MHPPLFMATTEVVAVDTSPSAKWLRRAVTFPGLVALVLLDLAALPLTLAGAVIVDLARRSRFAAVRFHLAVAFALTIHLVGLGLVTGAWLVGLVAGRAREGELDFRSEAWWASATWRAAVRLYRMNVVVEGEDALERGGPLVVMSRHASLLDVLLPAVFVSSRHRLVAHYVAKRELLWDPCVDLFGHRLAMAFVRRGGQQHELDVAAVRGLAGSLGRRDALVIFPEGTRFTEAKRERLLASLARKDPAAFARAARLRHLLPPHEAGPLAVLDEARGADVVFCAHTGLERAGRLADLLGGTLIDATVRVRYWRVAAAEVPVGREARAEWLRRWWERLDEWISSRERADSLTPSA